MDLDLEYALSMLCNVYLHLQYVFRLLKKYAKVAQYFQASIVYVFSFVICLRTI